jgi:hypothetical protein
MSHLECHSHVITIVSLVGIVHQYNIPSVSSVWDSQYDIGSMSSLCHTQNANNIGFPCVISMFYKKHLENIRPSVTLVLHAKYDFNMSGTCEISIMFSVRSVRFVEFDNGMLFPVIHQ